MFSISHNSLGSYTAKMKVKSFRDVAEILLRCKRDVTNKRYLVQDNKKLECAAMARLVEEGWSGTMPGRSTGDNCNEFLVNSRAISG